MTEAADRFPQVIAASGRRFATTPAAVLVFVVDDEERVLVFRHPSSGVTEVVNGAVEAGETVLEAAERELREEAGPDLIVRFVGVFHALSYRYDDRVPRMLSVCLVACHEGGEAVPGDDVAGATVAWLPAGDLAAGRAGPTIPEQGWLFTAAADAASAWGERRVDLDPYRGS